MNFWIYVFLHVYGYLNSEPTTEFIFAIRKMNNEKRIELQLLYALVNSILKNIYRNIL